MTMTRPAPPTGCSPSPAALTGVVSLLDEAQRELATIDLAALLIEVQDLIAPIATGRLPQRPSHGALSPAHPRLAPAARMYERAVRVALCECLVVQPPAALSALGRWLDGHLEDLAGRPRGCGLGGPGGG